MIKVVVVEDEALVRKGLVMTTPWHEFGCEVVGTASNGIEGEQLIRQLSPEIVFTDIKMPIMDGISMIMALSDLKDVEYIIISGYSEFEYAKQAVKLGVKDYLLKPVDDDELKKAIERLVKVIFERKQYKKIHDEINNVNDSKIMLFKEYFCNSDVDSKENYVLAAAEYIKKNFSRDISIKDAADHLHISDSYLSRLFKNETNHTFLEYLTNYRVKKAIELLKDQSVKIYEISNLIGYKDSRYFSAIFKKLVGVTPTEFKDRLNT